MKRLNQLMMPSLWVTVVALVIAGVMAAVLTRPRDHSVHLAAITQHNQPVQTTATEPPTTLAPDTTTTEPPSTTTAAPVERSTPGVEPGMLEAIVACEPDLHGLVLDVGARTGPYAEAQGHLGNWVYDRPLAYVGGHWYDAPEGEMACAPRPTEGQSASGVGFGPSYGNIGWFETTRDHTGELFVGSVSDPRIVLVVAMGGGRVVKGSVGGGVWMVLAIDRPPISAWCGYDSSRHLVVRGAVGAAGPTTGAVGSPGADTPPPTTEPTATCPSNAPEVE